ncbi:hypothetical protein AB0H58_16765 [Nocardia neocaledoniensis]|uniref:hypothetical protein n=1 Tax=Nocardia neocaledoniensis TaxID=236511 RepID=UPI0033D00C09
MGSFALRADELRVLGDACAEADLIERLQSALDADELMTTGSQGQPVVNPLVSELRQHRATLAGLLRQLKLPDDEQPGEVVGGDNRSTQARAAAIARWSRRGAAPSARA